MASTYTKTCPDCGAENDSNDLFCKDCGTSLAMVNNSSQQTSSFSPVGTVSETQTTMITPAAPAPASNYAAIPAAQPAQYAYYPEPESVRGAVLGWLALVLILVIVAAFLWSSVISDSTRESITGFF